MYNLLLLSLFLIFWTSLPYCYICDVDIDVLLCHLLGSYKLYTDIYTHTYIYGCMFHRDYKYLHFICTCI